MVTRVPIYLGGTGESTQAAAQAALGLHTSNSVAFTTVTIGAVNVLANDYATLLSAYSNDVTTLATARGNDHATLLSAYSNDVTTLATARGNDHATLLSAYSNDVTTLDTARGNDHATLLSAYSNDVTTLATARGNDHATLISATTNPVITGNVLINSNSANDALRINQIGSGNAFVVEDSANPDATPFVVDASGRVLAGITNGTSLALGGTIQSSVAGTAISGLTTNAGSSLARTHWRLAVIGNEIGGIGTVGTSMTFLTSNTEYMRIDSSGNVGIGTSSPTATLDVVGTFSDAKANTVQQTLTDAATIAWDTSLGRVATVTLGASRTFGAPTNLKVGTYILHVIQGGVGSYTITWNGVFKWTAATAPTLSTAVGRRDIFSFISDGTNLYGAMIPDVR